MASAVAIDVAVDVGFRCWLPQFMSVSAVDAAVAVDAALDEAVNASFRCWLPLSVSAVGFRYRCRCQCWLPLTIYGDNYCEGKSQTIIF